MLMEQIQHNNIAVFVRVPSEILIDFNPTPGLCHATKKIFTVVKIFQVEDDVVSCEMVEDEKCEDVTEGYTTTKKCQKWPRQQCSLSKKTTTKYTTMTGCNKEPTEFCAPAECGVKEVRLII